MFLGDSMIDGGSFCLVDGSNGLSQGINEQQYQMTQPCYYGKVYLVSPTTIGVGGLSDAVSSVLLGDQNNVINRHPPLKGFYWNSLHYDSSNQTVAITFQGTTVSLLDTETTTLLTTSAAALDIPITGERVGAFYLVRFASKPGTTKNIGEDTTNLFVMSVVSTSPVVLEWGVIASVDPAQAIAAAFPVPRSYRSSGTAVAAIIFALFGVVLGSISVCMIWRQSGYTRIQ